MAGPSTGRNTNDRSSINEVLYDILTQQLYNIIECMKVKVKISL
jgi:hypothetical protein